MQVEAIYSQGGLEFVRPLKLKHDQLRLVVIVPDDEIDASDNPYNLEPEVLAEAQTMLAKFDAIRNAPRSAGQSISELSPKQLQRIEAFELRAQLRQEQGRPV
jgi:hypothetical protein